MALQRVKKERRLEVGFESTDTPSRVQRGAPVAKDSGAANIKPILNWRSRPFSLISSLHFIHTNKQAISELGGGAGWITVYSTKVNLVRQTMNTVLDLGKQGIAIEGENYESRTEFLFSKDWIPPIGSLLGHLTRPHAVL